MLAKACTLALIGSAAAFNAPMMSAGATRRQAIAGAAAAGVALPLAANSRPRGFDQKAPVVEIFDSRGCDIPHKEYQGVYNGDMEDQQCVKVSMQTISVSELTAASKRNEYIGGKASGINVEQISSVTKKQWY